MSGTRSPSPRARATEALIVAHGQPSDPAPPEAALEALAARVQALTAGCRVQSATLAMPGAVKAALARAFSPPVVYPLFMSDGWFTRTELPRRLGGQAAGILPPLGLDPRLVQLAAGEIGACAAARGWPLAAVTVVVAAHGSSRGPRAARAAHHFAERLRRCLPLARLNVGFVEQAPSIQSAARAAQAPAFCLPFFAARGEHFREDIPDALTKAGFTGELLPPVGRLAGVPRLISARLGAADPLTARFAPADRADAAEAADLTRSM